jgi:hypothetical protein
VALSNVTRALVSLPAVEVPSPSIVNVLVFNTFTIAPCAIVPPVVVYMVLAPEDAPAKLFIVKVLPAETFVIAVFDVKPF